MERCALKIDGPAFTGGMPLHLVTDSLDAVQGIFDKAYLASQGRERITQDDRQAFYVRSYKIESGSLFAELEIVVQVVAPLLPLFATVSSSTIWDYTKVTFEFLKLVFQATKRGDRPKFTILGNEATTVHIGDQHNTFYGPVYAIGKASVPSYQRLTANLDPDKVHNIDLYSIKNGGLEHALQLGLPDRDLFDLPAACEEDTVSLVCEIFDFNKYENKGRLRVLEKQAVPEGRYAFSVEGGQDSIDYIRSMLRPTVRLRCRREYRDDPFQERVITRLIVVGIEKDG